ncbi:MAG: hypothetical protein HC878_12215 [Leptolyngbyaceae cyanobacterium SL_5_14]|nr:hypothetical protein [Leptolyngbyaceae cyanobacterium SL_5_14]
MADGIVGPSTWERLLPVSPSVGGVSSSTGAIAPSTANPAIPDTVETTAATLAFPAPSAIEPTATPTAPANATEPANTASNSTPAASTDVSEAATSASAGGSSEANVQSDTQSNIDLPILRVGMRGPAVARLQERLRATGFFSGAIDGVFGTETQNAVRAAQRNFDLEPDGVVGPATWGALLR